MKINRMYLLLVLLLLVIGCGNDTDGNESGDAATDSAIDADSLPNGDSGSMDSDSGADTGNGLSRTNLQIAVIPLIFSDQEETDVPTQAELEAILGSADMVQLFDDNSNRSATFSVEVAPYQDVPATQFEMFGDDFSISEEELSVVDVTLPQFSAADNYLIFFAAFDEAAFGGYPTSWTVMDYGGFPLPRASLNGELVPHMMMLTANKNDINQQRDFGFASFDPRTDTHSFHEGIITPESRPMTYLQSTLAHEMVHYLGFGPHANSWDKGERFFFEPPDMDDELRLNYGNHFALLGTGGCLTPVMHSVYRHAVGWSSDFLEELTANEDRRVTIAPINRIAGVTTVRYVTDGTTGDGIYLELREDDGWHDFMKATPLLAENLNGIMVLVREGSLTEFTSYVVDASPMPRASSLSGDPDLYTFNDVVLKPGMEMHMPQMSLTEVQVEADNHMSVRIQTFDTPREILHRPVRPTFVLAADSATITWNGSTHADTTGFEVEVIAADGGVVSTTVSGAGETSADLDVSGIAAGGELHARVRAVGAGHPANWSRDIYVIPAP